MAWTHQRAGRNSDWRVRCCGDELLANGTVHGKHQKQGQPAPGVVFREPNFGTPAKFRCSTAVVALPQYDHRLGGR